MNNSKPWYIAGSAIPVFACAPGWTFTGADGTTAVKAPNNRAIIWYFKWPMTIAQVNIAMRLIAEDGAETCIYETWDEFCAAHGLMGEAQP